MPGNEFLRSFSLLLLGKPITFRVVITFLLNCVSVIFILSFPDDRGLSLGGVTGGGTGRGGRTTTAMNVTECHEDLMMLERKPAAGRSTSGSGSHRSTLHSQYDEDQLN